MSNKTEREIIRLRKQLFKQLLKGIKESLSKISVVDTAMLYNYIDSDNKRDILRIKTICLVNEKQALIKYDQWNGEGKPSKLNPEDDEQFDNEKIIILDKIEPINYSDFDRTFGLEFMSQIYWEVRFAELKERKNGVYENNFQPDKQI